MHDKANLLGANILIDFSYFEVGRHTEVNI